MPSRCPERRLALAAAVCAGGVLAAEPPPEDAPAVVVTASRIEQRAFDTAASVDVVGAPRIRNGQGQVLVSDALARVPGIFALNRQNHAQDLLISSRGFGANSTFGARGLRVIVDGIPATMADGQTQTSHIDLPSAARIEVMRGPFATLHGNASGGVINVFTERGQPGLEAEPSAMAGSFGSGRASLKVSGAQGAFDWVADAGRFDTDGFRQHGAARRDNWNLRLGAALSPDTALQVAGNGLRLEAQDPLGLTAAQLQQDRTQAGSHALAYDTRKTVDQAQGGVSLAHRLDGADSFDLSAYAGDRRIVQYQSGTAASGLVAATNGVIDLARRYQGGSLRWTHRGELLGTPANRVLGLEANRNDDRRRTYDNLAGVRQPANAGNQDLNQSARNLDGFAQAEWSVHDRLMLGAGARHSTTTLDSVANNGGSGTGNHRYRDLTGMVSALHHLSDATNLHVALGTGFDTPTLNQLAYSPAYVLGQAATNAGNFGLLAARTRQVEVGLKHELPAGGHLRVAAFSTRTIDDIVIAASNAGRTAFANAPRTRRDGLELDLSLALPAGLRFDAACTLLDARVSRDYPSSFGGVPVAIPSGSRIPGVPNRGLFGELTWRRGDGGLEAALEARAAGAMAANDLNGAMTSGYGVLAARLMARRAIGPVGLSGFVRVDNLADKSHVGSVIVNQSRGGYYEPGPGRAWMAGVSARLTFQ